MKFVPALIAFLLGVGLCLLGVFLQFGLPAVLILGGALMAALALLIERT